MREDVPALLAEAEGRHPGVACALTPPLGEAPGLLDLMHGVVSDAARAAAPAADDADGFGFFSDIAKMIEAENG